jgi:hypothetical protein
MEWVGSLLLQPVGVQCPSACWVLVGLLARSRASVWFLVACLSGVVVQSKDVFGVGVIPYSGSAWSS